MEIKKIWCPTCKGACRVRVVANSGDVDLKVIEAICPTCKGTGKVYEDQVISGTPHASILERSVDRFRR